MAQVLVGLHRIGIVGLREAFEQARDSGLEDRQALVELMMTALSGHNFVPDTLREAFPEAVWREYVRQQGGDIRDLLSLIPVTIAGEPGDAAEALARDLTRVLAEFELRPEITWEPPAPGLRGFAISIADRPITTGRPGFGQLRHAVQRQISDW